MRNYLKHLYHDTVIGHRLISPAINLYHFFCPRILPDKIYRRYAFKKTLGYKLNLDNPKTYNEKINWLLLNDRTPLHTLCADKYAVREYVKKKIGEQYLIPLVFQSTNPKDIIPKNLPDYPVIIKTNHGCGGHVTVYDKNIIDWKKVQKNLKKSLKKNFYYKGREWQYKNIEPCVIVEKLLLNEHSEIPSDYKFYICNGKIVMIQVMKRTTELEINYYDTDWKPLNIDVTQFKTGLGVKIPKNFNKFKSLAITLAGDFRFVRVDLYNLEGKIYFGEITFSPAAGFEVLNPPKWDRIFGDQLEI